ncbi:MAG: hypothetical protein JOZ42_12085 [Acetobacteraceae bacterium]|nr:hypothetical protein [Acetobacteraceae bacterium]
MRRDGLRSALRLRRLAQAEARRQLADRLDAQTAAEAMVGEADAAIEREQAAALDLVAGDEVVEAFIAWLPAGRKVRAQAEALRQAAVAETARARAVLTAARSALHAAERVASAREAAIAKRLRRRQGFPVAELAQRPSAEKGR